MDFFVKIVIVCLASFGPIRPAAVAIKTYGNIENGTLLEQEDAAPGGPVSAQELNDLVRTYAIFAENHLAILEFLLNRPHDMDLGQPMSMSLKVNAEQVYANCDHSLRNHGRAVPGWLTMFLELLDQVTVTYNQVVFKRGATDRTQRIRWLIKEQHDVNIWPCAEFYDENVRRFIDRNPRFLRFLDETRRDRKEELRRNGCRDVEMINLFGMVDGKLLTKCETLTVLYYLARNLMELQMVLDSNRDQLPYHDPSGGSSSALR